MASFKALPPLSDLRNLLNYDPITGIFTWRKSRGTKAIGSVAGCIEYGYLKIRINRQNYFAHRIAWLMQTGEDPGDLCVDHIDRNKANNSFSNLRVCTHSQNQCNRIVNRKGTSKRKGVSFNKQANKWTAQIEFCGKKTHLGYFEDPELAYKVYCEAATRIHGEFARVS